MLSGFITLLLSGCFLNRLWQVPKNEAFSFDDTLIVKNYFYVQINNGAFNAPYDSADSAIQRFEDHLASIGLPVRFAAGAVNKADYGFLVDELECCGERGLDWRLVEHVKNAVDAECTAQHAMVPYFQVRNTALHGQYRSSVLVAVFIVRNGEIVYFGREAAVSNLLPFWDYEEVRQNFNSEQDWLMCIEGALKDYIQRMRFL